MSSKIADKRREKYASDPEFRERVKMQSYKWRQANKDAYNKYHREYNKRHRTVNK